MPTSGAPSTATPTWAPDAGPDSVVFQCDGTSSCENGTLSWSCAMDCAGATCEISLRESGLRGSIPAGLGDVRCANQITMMCAWARPVPPVQPRAACARSASHSIVLRAQRPLRERCADRRGAGECREAAQLEYSVRACLSYVRLRATVQRRMHSCARALKPTHSLNMLRHAQCSASEEAERAGRLPAMEGIVGLKR